MNMPPIPVSLRPENILVRNQPNVIDPMPVMERQKRQKVELPTVIDDPEDGGAFNISEATLSELGRVQDSLKGMVDGIEKTKIYLCAINAEIRKRGR